MDMQHGHGNVAWIWACIIGMDIYSKNVDIDIYIVIDIDLDMDMDMDIDVEVHFF
jgi:hypothetical protein